MSVICLCQIENLARMLANKRKKAKKNGEMPVMRQVVALSSQGSGDDGDRTRERRKRKHKARLVTQQQELMEEVGETLKVKDRDGSGWADTSHMTPRTEERVRDAAGKVDSPY